MAEFALVIGGSLVEIRNYADRPPDIAHKSVQWFPVVREEGEEFSGIDGDTYLIAMPAPEPPDPGLTPPTLVASAINVAIANSDVSSIDGAFNLIGALYIDVGQYMLLFLQPEPDANYLCQMIDGGRSLSVSEKNTDYLIVEAKEAGSGTYVDPSNFSVQVYRI